MVKWFACGELNKCVYVVKETEPNLLFIILTLSYPKVILHNTHTASPKNNKKNLEVKRYFRVFIVCRIISQPTKNDKWQ